ncbi:MAG: RecQ family ATP-dependent DNA helicase [Bacteroidales bacterium]|nr:RecQ family ATP-dependent DNA helicase [Bacteroidales bacterium]
MTNIRNILIRYWGFSTFRPMQEEIIQSVLDGKDTLALLPTGGGKSVCFQVPAMALDGVCLVITPLIALMKDQVENLKKKSIKAVAVYSGMHRNEIQIAFDNCVYGDVKFLYLSPERLKTDQFQQIIRKLKVNLLAVDEAHCISQWGYDFRPPYLQIAEIRKFIPDVPVLALTATATTGVITDIQKNLGFKTENVFRKSFERKNLTYVVIKEEDKNGRLLRILKKIAGPGIIYARNRKKTVETAIFLQKNGIKADFYHAGLDVSSRNRRQDAWIKDESRIMVATNAFGMGIDKPNVRLVVHIDLPDSLEAYFQEAGRVGRDEKRAYAVTLFQQADLARLQENLEREFPPVEKIKEIYQALGNYLQLPVGSGKDESFDFEIYAFSRNYNFNPVIVFNALRFLEREGYILMNESMESPSRIHFESSREDIYRFQVENKTLDPFIKLLLRSYSGVFTDFVQVNESELSKRAGIKEEEVVSNLQKLQKAGILSYAKRPGKPQIIFPVERLDMKNLQISPENYHERKRFATIRMEAVMEYITSDEYCRSLMLLKYFGETGATRCGRCDVCLERNKMNLNEIEFNQIRHKVKELLQQKPMTLPELVFDAGSYGEAHMLLVIRWLEDKGAVIKDDQMRYTWRKQFRLKI